MLGLTKLVFFTSLEHIYHLVVSACCWPRSGCQQQVALVTGVVLPCSGVGVSPVVYDT